MGEHSPQNVGLQHVGETGPDLIDLPAGTIVTPPGAAVLAPAVANTTGTAVVQPGPVGAIAGGYTIPSNLVPPVSPSVDKAVAPTQQLFPWRTVARTAFQVIVALAAIAPFLYKAATNNDPALATGLAGAVLPIAAGLTRLMATTQANTFLAKFVPFLAATPKE